MKIFVTGSGGFVAAHLIPRLQEIGLEVLTDMRYLRTEKYEAVIHLAAKTNIGCDFDPALIYSNVVLTEEVFRLNTRIIYASSCSAEHLTNPYAYSKRYGEHLCMRHGNSIALRFHNIYGPGARRGVVKFLLEQSDGAKVIVRGPDLIRDYIHVSDIVDFIVNHALPATRRIHPFQDVNQKKVSIPNIGIVDVGTRIGTSTMDLVNLFQKLAKKQFDIHVAAPGSNEPDKMVAWNSRVEKPISLEEGLLKMIYSK